MSDECPHCTPDGEFTLSDISFTAHFDPHPLWTCDALAGVSEVTVSILDVAGKERDRFDAAVEQGDGERRIVFPHDPQIQVGETVSIIPPLALDTPRTPDTA